MSKKKSAKVYPIEDDYKGYEIVYDERTELFLAKVLNKDSPLKAITNNRLDNLKYKIDQFVYALKRKKFQRIPIFDEALRHGHISSIERIKTSQMGGNEKEAHVRISYVDRDYPSRTTAIIPSKHCPIYADTPENRKIIEKTKELHGKIDKLMKQLALVDPEEIIKQDITI